MSPVIEQISRQDKDFLKHTFRLRKTVFEKELKFPSRDRIVYNEWDSLSNHYLLINQGVPIGTISVVDWTGLTEILNTQHLPTKLKIAKLTKLAILPEERNIKNLKSLVYFATKELINFDYVTADIAPPSNNPSDLSRYKLVKQYKRLFGMSKIACINEGNLTRQILGKKINNSCQLH